MLAWQMLKQNLTYNRADRVSAIGRLAFAFPTLGAAILDTPHPETAAPIVIRLLVAYVVVAVVVVAFTWLRRLSARPVGHIVHAIDLVVFAALVFLTHDVSSPFFPLYLFAILSATLRWDWRGALGTSVAIIALFMPMIFIHAGGLDPAHDDLLRYIVRIGQIMVVGGMLAYIGVQRERSWLELLHLSQPVALRGGSIDAAIIDVIDHARAFFAVPRAVFVWEMREEPGWHIVQTGDSPSLPTLSADYAGPVASTLAGAAFDIHAESNEGRCYGADGRLTTTTEPQFDPALLNVLQISDAVIASIACDALAGWLVIPKRGSEEDLYLARALAVQLTAAINHAGAAETLRAAAASEERVRVAHDLHDGILQFLTGLALQLRLIEQQNGRDPAAVSERIAVLTNALRREQQDLRQFLEVIRPRGHTPVSGERSLPALAAVLGDQWDIVVDAAGTAEPPPELANDIRAIIREATANAVRHGNATRVALTSEVSANGYRLAITDNGRGFAQPGHFTADTLHDQQQGPQSILDRVTRMDAQFTLDTSPKGTMLQLLFPPARETPQ